MPFLALPEERGKHPIGQITIDPAIAVQSYLYGDWLVNREQPDFPVQRFRAEHAELAKILAEDCPTANQTRLIPFVLSKTPTGIVIDELYIEQSRNSNNIIRAIRKKLDRAYENPSIRPLITHDPPRYRLVVLSETEPKVKFVRRLLDRRINGEVPLCLQGVVGRLGCSSRTLHRYLSIDSGMR